MTSTIERSAGVPESLQGIKIIDADTHLTEPGDLWTARAPEKYRDLVPRVVEIEHIDGASQARLQGGGLQKRDGHNFYWVVGEDKIIGQAGSGSVVNRHNQKVRGSEFRHWPLSEASAAASFVEPRLDLMDEVGIWAQIMYPNLVGFGGQNFRDIADPKLRDLCARIYNDAMVDYKEASGGRINGMAIIPWWDIDLAVREVERVHDLGLKGLNTNADPQLDGLPDLSDPHWEPLWDVCESLNMPINFHIGASQTQVSWFGTASWPSFDDERKLALGGAVLYLSNARIIGNLIYSGILERHPRLNFVSVESGIGWIPFLLEALDYQVGEVSAKALDFLSMKPSDYFRRQIYACFWFENENMLTDVQRLGYDKCLFETDFPHPTCLYPNPLSAIGAALESVDFEDRRRLLSGNAAKVYNIDVA